MAAQRFLDSFAVSPFLKVESSLGKGNGLYLEEMLVDHKQSTVSETTMELKAPVQLASININTEIISANSLWKLLATVDSSQELKSILRNFAVAFTDEQCAVELTERISVLALLYILKCYGRDGMSKFSGIANYSFLLDYIAVLPGHVSVDESDFDNPVIWHDEELHYLQGTPLFMAVDGKQSSLFREIEFLYDALFLPLHQYVSGVADPGDEWFDPQVYIWADLVYWTRVLSRNESRRIVFDFSTFQFPSESILMIPVLDFANHSPQANISWRIEEESVIVETCSNLRCFKISNATHVCTQLMLNYGPKSNAELLFTYGFCIEENRAFDSFSIPMFIENSDSLKCEKIAILREHGLKPIIEITRAALHEAKESCDVAVLCSKDTIKMIKIVQATSAEELIYAVGKDLLLNMNFLVESCVTQLRELREFQNPLMSKSNHRIQMALIYRQGLKKFLEEIIDMCNSFS